MNDAFKLIFWLTLLMILLAVVMFGCTAALISDKAPLHRHHKHESVGYIYVLKY